MYILFMFASALLAGLFVSRLTRLLNLPAVTAYLIAGILIGPFCLGALGVPGLGFTSFEDADSISVVSDAALGFIAFAIGNEFRLSQLKGIGKKATVIGIVQAVTATVLVDLLLISLHFMMPDKISLPLAIMLGAIAAATAPAATLMVVRQYKAKGPLTDLLLPIVALDDAVGLIIFAVSFGISQAMTSGTVNILSIVVEPLIEICASLLLGAAMGALLTLTERFFHSRSKRMSLSLAFVFLTVALSLLKFHIGPVKIGFSSLLTCMMLGTLFCNMCDFSAELMDRTDKWTAPLFILFFVLSGAYLDFSVFADPFVIVIGLVYVAARAGGKFLGTYLSARAMGCSPVIRDNLGFTLLPQAGVALGMSATATALGEDGMLIRSIVLFGVLIFELIGPTVTKVTLTRSGDITPMATSARVALPKPGSR